jgi:hypothetical protein
LTRRGGEVDFAILQNIIFRRNTFPEVEEVPFGTDEAVPIEIPDQAVLDFILNACTRYSGVVVQDVADDALS